MRTGWGTLFGTTSLRKGCGMTPAQIKRTFKRLELREQADLLVELVTSLARTLDEEDRLDEEVFRQRAGEEDEARPWREVKAALRSSARSKDR